MLPLCPSSFQYNSDASIYTLSRQHLPSKPSLCVQGSYSARQMAILSALRRQAGSHVQVTALEEALAAAGEGVSALSQAGDGDEDNDAVMAILERSEQVILASHFSDNRRLSFLHRVPRAMYSIESYPSSPAPYDLSNTFVHARRHYTQALASLPQAPPC